MIHIKETKSRPAVQDDEFYHEVDIAGGDPKLPCRLEAAHTIQLMVMLILGAGVLFRYKFKSLIDLFTLSACHGRPREFLGQQLTPR